MEPLEKGKLMEEIESYGYGLLHPGKKPPEELIPEIMESGESRLLYSIPVILLEITPEGLDALAEKGPGMKRMLYLTLLLYREEGIAKSLQEMLLQRTGEIPALGKEFSKDRNIEVLPELRINAGAMKENFKNYLLLKESKGMLSESIELSIEMNTRHHLSKLFSRKQREIILKKLNRRELTKTEKEYLSRTIKPKLEAILNPEIGRIASLLV